MTLPKELTTVTPLSKTLALLMFIAIPIIAFFYGMQYQETIDLQTRQQQESQITTPKRIPTPTPDETANSNDCAPKFTIEHAMELTASESYSNQCYNQTTKDACEKVDIYRASIKNFGNSDGIPDCQWIQKQEQTVDTANWKTYNNIEHSYSLKYPPNLEVDYQASFQADTDKEIDTVFKTDNGFLKIVNYPGGRGVSPIRAKNITIAGIETVKFYESETIVTIRAIINYVYKEEIGFEYTLSKDKESAEKEDALFDQILSTFRFTN